MRTPRESSTGLRAVRISTAVAAAAGVFCSGVLYSDLRARHGSPTATGAPARAVSAAASVGQGTTAAASARPVTPAPRPPASRPAPAQNAVRAAAPGTAASEAAPPVRVRVPALDIDQPLVGLRVTADRRLQVPQDYDEIGWWSDGPAPGDPGAALLVGHVDSTEGPAVFYHLSTLDEGDVVALQGADGRTTRFIVRGAKSFPKDDFPDDLVYRTKGKRSLHLVTCGGTFDRSTGHYRDNLVVFADLVQEAPPARRAPAPAQAAAPAPAQERAAPRVRPQERAAPRVRPQERTRARRADAVPRNPMPAATVGPDAARRDQQESR